MLIRSLFWNLHFPIRTIPNLLFCPVEGKPWMKLGTVGKPQLKKMLDDLLNGVSE